MNKIYTLDSLKDTHFSVKDYYQGKRILITGCTGFIGKVILEKMLRSCPNIDCIYVFVRPKKGKLPMDRIKNEIFSSLCFSELKKRELNFGSFID